MFETKKGQKRITCELNSKYVNYSGVHSKSIYKTERYFQKSGKNVSSDVYQLTEGTFYGATNALMCYSVVYPDPFNAIGHSLLWLSSQLVLQHFCGCHINEGTSTMTKPVMSASVVYGWNQSLHWDLNPCQPPISPGGLPLGLVQLSPMFSVPFH